MGRGVGELQNALELTCNVSCTLLCIHATAAFPFSSPLNLMLAIGDLSSALLLLFPSSAISATCLRDCQLLLERRLVVAVSSSPPSLSRYSLLLLSSPYLAVPLSLSRAIYRWSQTALSLLFCGLKSLAGFLSIMDFGSSLPRETADRYHHSSEAIGKMEKRTSGSHNNSRCRSINTRKAKQAKKLWEEERSSKGKAYEEHLLQQATCKQRHSKKRQRAGGRIPGRTIFSLWTRSRDKPIDDAHHRRDCNNKQSEVWFLLLLIASLENRSRNTLSSIIKNAFGSPVLL